MLTKKQSDFLNHNLHEFKTTEDSFSRHAAYVSNVLRHFEDLDPYNPLLLKISYYFQIINETSNIWDPYFDANDHAKANFFIDVNNTLIQEETKTGDFLMRFFACGWVLKNYMEIHNYFQNAMKVNPKLRQDVSNDIRAAGCNLTLEQLIPTPFQRLIRYSTFSKGWVENVTTLADTDAMKIAVLNLNAKFGYMATSSNQIAKAMELQEKLKKTGQQQENLVDSILVKDTFSNALKYNPFGPKEPLIDDEIEQFPNEDSDQDHFFAPDKMPPLDEVPEPIFDRSTFLEDFNLSCFMKPENDPLEDEEIGEKTLEIEEIEEKTLEDLIQDTIKLRILLISDAFSNIENDLKNAIKQDARTFIISPKQFSKAVSNEEQWIEECTDDHFYRLLELIELVRRFVVTNSDEDKKELLKQIRQIESSLIEVKAGRVTAYVITLLACIAIASVCLNPTFLFIHGTISLSILLPGSFFAGIGVTSMIAGFVEAKQTFLPSKVGFFALTHAAKNLTKTKMDEISEVKSSDFPDSQDTTSSHDEYHNSASN